MAIEFYNTYNKGSDHIKSRMLEKIIDLVKINAQLFGSTEDWDEMTDAELEATASLLVAQQAKDDDDDGEAEED